MRSEGGMLMRGKEIDGGGREEEIFGVDEIASGSPMTLQWTRKTELGFAKSR